MPSPSAFSLARRTEHEIVLANLADCGFVLISKKSLLVVVQFCPGFILDAILHGMREGFTPTKAARFGVPEIW